MGARAQGMGYASSCLSDVWSLTNNVAGLAKIKSAVGAVSYDAVPSFESFNRMAAAIALPFRTFAVGASVFRFGDDLYNEQILSLGISNTFGLASLGVKMNYIQYRAEGVEPYGAFTVSFGGIAALTPDLSFGAHIVNINQPIVHHVTGERIPTRLVAGMAFTLSEKLVAAAEIEKDLRHTPTLKAGIEYQPVKKIAFRSGVNLHPESAFFGLGFKIRKLDLDYSLQYKHIFGLSHHAAVTFPLSRK